MVLPMEVQFTAVFDKVVFVLEAYTIISMEFKERYHENITNGRKILIRPRMNFVQRLLGLCVDFEILMRTQ